MPRSLTLTRANYRSGLDDARRAVEAVLRAHPTATVVVAAPDELPKRRNMDQNDRLNAMCGDVAEQVVWHGQKLSRDDWRHMFVASYRKGQQVVPGIDGGFVVLGASSKKLTVAECSDVIEIIFAFGAEHGVKWRKEG